MGPDMSTNRRSYPHGETSYPHFRTAQDGRAGSLRGVTGAGSVRVEELAKGPDVPPEVIVLSHLPLDLLAAVEHGRVIAPTERLTDSHEWSLGLLAHQVHGDLARQDDLPVAGLSLDLVEWDAVVLRDGLDDAIGRKALAVRVVEKVLKHLLRELRRDRHGLERRERDDARERALELADVRHDPLSKEVDHRRRHRHVLRLRLGAKDRDPCLQIGGRVAGR